MSEHVPEHDLVPENPQPGEVFTCWCGDSAEFVVLGDGRPGEWVARMTPDRSAHEGLVEALARETCPRYPSNNPCRDCLAQAEALAPTVARPIDAAVAQRTAHLVIEAEQLREVVGRVEALADEWEAAEEPPGEDYEGTSDGHVAFGEYLATWQHARDLRAALRAGCEGRDGAPEAAGADLRASQGVPGVSGPTEASAGAREVDISQAEDREYDADVPYAERPVTHRFRISAEMAAE